MLVSLSGPWTSPVFVRTAPLCLSMGAWTRAKRQAFITWSEVLRLKQKPVLDTNTPPQVNNGPGKEGRGAGGEQEIESRRCVVAF